jgi:hypothetical protein
LKERENVPPAFDAGADATEDPDEPAFPPELPPPELSPLFAEVGWGVGECVSVGVTAGQDRVTL